jgi:nicotinate phosphoribosyltransferase
VRIVASGGFDATKIASFEDQGVPVDAYGVGSSLLLGSNDFTGDIVRVDGRPCAKVGRSEQPNPRLATVALVPGE